MKSKFNCVTISHYASITLHFIGGNIILSILNEFKAIFIDIGHGIEHVWLFFAIGIAIEALIRTFKWHVKIRKMLSRFGIFSIFVATILGATSPLCACGTLPLMISLIAGGLTLAPAMALLVTAPLMSPGGYFICVDQMGLVWANALFGAAIFMGLFAGYVTLMLEKKWFQADELLREKLPEGNFHDPDYPDERLKCLCGEQFSNKLARKTSNKFLIYLAKYYEGAKKIGKFFLIGVVIEVVAKRYIGFEWFYPFIENDYPLIVPAIAIGAIPLHLPQASALPILGGINRDLIFEGIQMSKSVGMAFLVGGPVTAIPAMGVFLALFKKRVFFLYVSLCVTGTLIVSYLYELLF